MRTGLTLFVILAGFPAALVALAGSPLPSRAPTSADLVCWLDNPTAPQFLPGLLAAIAWLSWALATTVALRLAAARSAARVSRLVQHLPGPLQGLAATVLGAAAVAASYSPAAAAAPAPAVATAAQALPERPAVLPAHHAGPTYTVHQGDTLSKIAKKKLGDPDRWPTIFKLNRGKQFPAVGGRLTDPDVIYPGWKLRLPDKVIPRPARPTRPADPGHSTAPAPHITATPVTASPQAASPTGGGHSSSAATISFAALTATTGFAYAMGLLWRRRRHHRPAAATAALPATEPPPRRRPEPAPTTTGPVEASPPDNPATALTGPGALDAARAALVAVLTGSLPDTVAVTTSATLNRLLPGAPAGERLTVTDDLGGALALLDEQSIRRSRLADDDSTGRPTPTMLLLAEVPDQEWHARLATAARLGEPLGIDITLLGPWPTGLTLTVAADGTTEAGDLAVLDAETATAVLAAQPQPSPAAATPPPEPAAATPPPEPAAAASAPESSRPARVGIRVLGRPAILGPDGHPVRGLRVKSLELCVLLVVNRDGAALGDIMESLWPEVNLARATDRLSTCVANLRNIIRAGVRAGSTGDNGRIEPVINTGGRYHLNPALVDVDWWQILDAQSAAATALDDRTCLRHLRTAIAAAAGRTLAADTAYEWIGTDRERARHHLVRLHLMAADLLTDTDPRAARALRDTACDYDPMSEELARDAMQAAADLGDADGIRHRREHLHRALAEAGIDADTGTDRFAADLLQNLTINHR
ncbi:LysM peptidoglycan-binding domain-containing protein [Actinoplanes sp. HUAS TT8]|uniref:LysM peptidoglycan-binding domain-containing protein n=1 Tax=Actinoplanes sp. HUAS TT8 TaxID=3447453 RepID=UPI003F528B5D